MTYTVKYRKDVPEKIRYNVGEFMHGKEYYETDTGVTAPMDGLFQYLLEEGYRAEVRSYGIEVLPLADWVKEEVATYPDQKSKGIIKKHLMAHGVPEEKVDEMMRQAND